MWISHLLSIVAPVLQRLVALAVGVVFGLLLLRQMSLAVSDHLAHVRDVLLLIALGVFRGILVQDLDDLAATVRVSGPPFTLHQVHDPSKGRSYLSCPTVSPEPSSLVHPEPCDCSPFSHPSNSFADMLTSSLNSLGTAIECQLWRKGCWRTHSLNNGFLVLDHCCYCSQRF